MRLDLVRSLFLEKRQAEYLFYIVFRAENSNTHRHLTEFTGLDVEMTIQSDYTEVMDILDGALLFIFKGLQSRYRDEVGSVCFRIDIVSIINISSDRSSQNAVPPRRSCYSG